MKRGIYGDVAKAVNCIPVERAQDIVKDGIGTIQFISEKEIKVGFIFFFNEFRVLEQYLRKNSVQVIVLGSSQSKLQQ